MTANPTLLSMPLAQNGQKNEIPETQATAGDGLFSQSTGFPAETSLPLGAGGVAPSREDFNGAFNLLSNIAFFAQKGWTFQYDATQDYYKGCVVIDPTDGLRYECIADMAAGTIAPSDDTAGTYWTIFKSGLDREQIPAFNHRDVITTSGTYTAPVSGWYHITCIGGGGAGGNGGNDSVGGLSGTQGGTSSFGLVCSASGGHSGAGSYNRGEGGGGAAGNIAYAFTQLTAGDTVSVVVGAGGVAPTSGFSSSATGANGSGGASHVSGSAEGASSVFGSGGNGGVTFVTYNQTAYGVLYPTGTGGSNGTPYGGGGSGAISSGYNWVYPWKSAPAGANGETPTTASISSYPKGGDGGNGAVIVEYFEEV